MDHANAVQEMTVLVRSPHRIHLAGRHGRDIGFRLLGVTPSAG